MSWFSRDTSCQRTVYFHFSRRGSSNSGIFYKGKGTGWSAVNPNVSCSVRADGTLDHEFVRFFRANVGDRLGAIHIPPKIRMIMVILNIVISSIIVVLDLLLIRMFGASGAAVATAPA
jgi:hypothetical protein